MSGTNIETTHAHSMAAVDHIQTRDALSALESDWDRLVCESGYHTIFQTFPWQTAWWDTLGADYELYVLAIREGGTVIGIAPLMRHPSGHVQFIGTPNADYSDIIGPDKGKLWPIILGHFVEHAGDWTTITFDQLTERASSHQALRKALQQSGLVYRDLVCDTCMTFEFDGTPEQAKEFELRKGTNLKKSIRQLEQLGGLHFDRLEGEAARHELQNFFHLHIMRWQHTPTPSKFEQEKHRRFYGELIDRLGSSHQAFFTVLRAGDIPLAYCMKFEYNGTINHYTLAFNPYFSRFSPGMVFVSRQTEFLVREGYKLDFSRGAQDYKSVITNRTYDNYQFTIFNSEHAARVYDLRKRVRRLGVVDRILSNRRMAGIKARIERLSANNGLSGMARVIASRLFGLIYDNYVILVFAHEGAPTPIPPPPIPVTVRELTREQLPLVATFYGAPHNGQKYQTLVRRFESGADCFGVFHEDNLVTVSWGLTVPDVDPIYGFVLAPGQGEVVLSDGVTSLPYRGKGLRSFLLHYQLDKYHRLGKRVLLATSQTNHSMLGVVRKFNFSHIRTARIVKLLGLRFRS